MRLKGIASLAISALLAVCIMLLQGCSARTEQGTGDGNGGRLTVYTSFYTMYDFTRKIGGDKINIRNLVPSGVEPHDWEPSPKDIAGLEKADLLIYNGAGMEGWIDKVLGSVKSKKLVAVEASKGIKLIDIADSHINGIAGRHTNGHIEGEGSAREISSAESEAESEAKNETGNDAKGETGSDNERETGSSTGHEEYNHANGNRGYDPHVWLNPMYAARQMETIKNALQEADPENRDLYEANYIEYARKLEELDNEYRQAIKKFKKKEIVVAHEAFGYLCEAYGLTQVAIEGLNADSEPTPARMAEITKFARENDVKVIFFEELLSPKIAETIAREINAETAVLNPLEGLKEEDIKAGKDYFSVMKDNLEALKKALM